MVDLVLDDLCRPAGKGLAPQLKAVSLILIKFVNEYAHGGPGLAVAAYLIIGKHGKE